MIADEYPEIYVGFNAGAFSFKQWYADRLRTLLERRAPCTPKRTTPRRSSDSLLAGVPCRLRLGRLLGRPIEQFDYAVQVNCTAGNFTIFGKFTGTDASDARSRQTTSTTTRPRFLVGVMTTFPWGD